MSSPTLPSLRRSSRIAAKNGRRTTAEMGEEVIWSLLDLQMLEKDQLDILLKNKIWSYMETTPSLPLNVRVDHHTRHVVNVFLSVFNTYLDVLHLERFGSWRYTHWEDNTPLIESINIVCGYLDNIIYKYKEEEKKVNLYEHEGPCEDRRCNYCEEALWEDEGDTCNWCEQQNRKAEWQEQLRQDRGWY